LTPFCVLTPFFGGTEGVDSSSIRVEGSSALVVEESTFSGAGAGVAQGSGSTKIAFVNGCTACRISNCEFDGVEGAIAGFGIDGLIVENCVMQTAPGQPPSEEGTIPGFLPLIQLGSTLGTREIQASNVTVRNCVLNGNFDISPACYPTPTEDCTFTASFQFPIYIGQASAILIDSCQIANCFVTRDFIDFATGGLINIFADDDHIHPHEITIRNCLLKGDGIQEFGFQDGIDVGNADSVLVEGCTVTGTFFGINPGIGTTNMTIRDCTVQNTGHCSIIFGTDDGEVNGVTIANNHLMNPGFNSVQIVKIDSEGTHKNVIVEGNTISNGFSSGIFFGETENCVARNNIVDTVGATGIPVENSVNTTIQDNTILNAGGEGISVIAIESDVANVLVQGNTVSNSGGFGIAVAAFDEFVTSDTLVQGNTVSNSALSGIILQHATNTTVQGNSFDYNGFDGEEGLAAGILVVTSTKTSLIDNICIGNTEGGIEIVAGSTDTYLQNNTTTQNGVVGILDDDNVGQVIAFYNTSCDNGVVNCVNVPLAVAPGDPVVLGANLCCDDPDAMAGAKKVKAANSDPSGPIVPPESVPAPDLSKLPKF